MKTKRQKSQVLRQVFLLMTAQSLAVASMIWGGSLTVAAQEPEAMVKHQMVSAPPCQGALASQHSHSQALARKKQPASVRLLDLSIGKPWG